MTDTCNDGCICLPLIIVLSVQVDLVTSVPSRQPIDPPTSDQILRLFLNRSNKRESKLHSKSFDDFCHILQPPCKRCLRETSRLGVRASVLFSSEVVMNSEELGFNMDNSEPNFLIIGANRDMKVKVEGNISIPVTYGLQRCRQLLMRNSTLLPRWSITSICPSRLIFFEFLYHGRSKELPGILYYLYLKCFIYCCSSGIWIITINWSSSPQALVVG